MSLKVLCEYFENPFSIDNPAPRFSWLDTGEKTGKQLSYQIVVAKDKDLKEKVWDSGLVNSDNSIDVVYTGEKLLSCCDYYYQVYTINSSNKKSSSNINKFTTGLMDPMSEWRAPFEGIPTMAYTCQVCRMELNISIDLAQAYSFIISPNYYVLTVNGEKTTETVLNNINTDLHKTMAYRMEDITSLLQKGKNVFGVDLGAGWPGIAPSLDHGDGICVNQFSMQILLIDKEGNREWVYTKPKDWKYTFDVAMLDNSIYGGETYDARKEIPGWDTNTYVPGLDGIEWQTMVDYEGYPSAKIVSMGMMEPIRITRTLDPIAIYHLSDNSYTIDFGQNISGWARLSIEGTRGQKIVLSYAENINDDYSINKLSLRKAKAIDTYILKGTGVEVYEPRFTYHGFRYVNITGLNAMPEKGTIIACVVRSDISQISSFDCDNELLNQLFSNVNWTEADNQIGIPTDCPQRDERLGWTNDATVRNETALYSFDVGKLYEKWMGDIRDSQSEVTGAYSDTAPFLRYGNRPQDPVAASPVNIPWNVYRFYGDKKIIEENYESNKSWARFLHNIAENDIIPYSYMGDWAGPMIGTTAGKDGAGIGGGAVSVITPGKLISTAFYYYIYTILAKQANVLGKINEKEYFEYRSAEIRKAFISKYYDSSKKQVATNSQGCNVIALYMGLVPEQDIDQVMKNLLDDIVLKNNTHLTTGNICSRYIIEVLFKYGYPDVAYDLLTQDTYPSWGYMVRKGATTIWERWEEIRDPDSILANMASCNHPMYGAFGIAFLKYLGGISPDDNIPGFKHFVIKPYIPSKLNKLNCSIKTISGVIKSSWKKNKGKLELSVTIPFNTTAELFIPAKGKVFENNTEIGVGTDGYFVMNVVPGEYKFVSEL